MQPKIPTLSETRIKPPPETEVSTKREKYLAKLNALKARVKARDHSDPIVDFKNSTQNNKTSEWLLEPGVMALLVSFYNLIFFKF